MVKFAFLAASCFLLSPGRLDICVNCASQNSGNSDTHPIRAAENSCSQTDAEEFLNVTPAGSLLFDFSKPIETVTLQQKLAELSHIRIQPHREIYSDDVTFVNFNPEIHGSILVAEICQWIRTLCILSNSLSFDDLKKLISPKLFSVHSLTLNMKDFQELDKKTIDFRP